MSVRSPYVSVANSTRGAGTTNGEAPEAFLIGRAGRHRQDVGLSRAIRAPDGFDVVRVHAADRSGVGSPAARFAALLRGTGVDIAEITSPHGGRRP
jgi:hypothetical protein